MKRQYTQPRLILAVLTLLLAGGLVLFQNVRTPNVHAAPAPPSATLTVINTNDSGAGSLRQAIIDAAPADTIDFNLTGCPCTITLTSGELIIDKDLTISGPGANVLAISGNNASRVFFFNPGAPGATTGPPASMPTVSISNLTIANGNAKGGNGGGSSAGGCCGGGGGGGGAAGMGGALFINSGALTISDVTFSQNKAIGGNGSINDTSAAGAGGGGGVGGNGTGGGFSGGPFAGTGGSGGSLGGNAGNGEGSGGNGGIGNTPGTSGGFGGGGGGGGGGNQGGGTAGSSGGFGGGGGGGGAWKQVGGPSGGFSGGTGGSFGGNGGSGNGTNGGPGGGGAGLGGAVFIRAGSLDIVGTTFSANSATGGAGGNSGVGGGQNGQGKGGAIFVNAGAQATIDSTTAFSGNVATHFTCGPTDNNDVYGLLSGFSFPLIATQVVFDQQPTSTAVGGNISPAVTAKVLDQCGNPYPGYTVSLSLGTNPSGATLSGTTSLAAINGIATFSDLSIDRPGRYTLTASSGGLTGSTSNLFAVYEESCVSGLRGWWKGENNGDDAGPIGNNGTLSNVGFAPGRVGQAFDFNGSGFVQVDNPLDLAPGNAVTLEAWVNPRSAACNTVLSRGNGTDASTDYMFDVGFNGSTCGTEMKVALFAAGAWDISNSAVPLNAWSHVAVSYDGQETRFYINGNLDRVVPHPGTLFHSVTPFYLGRQGTSCNCNYFRGLMDEPSVYNRALSASEVLAIFAAGSLGKCPANLAPVVKARNITIFADTGCHATVTAAQFDDGSFDPDSGDSITLSLDDYGPFSLGPHQVTLTAIDSHGASSSAVATATVVDATPPAITLNGPNPMTVELGSIFNDPGAAASDGCSGNITSSIVKTGSVNTAAVGSYSRYYNVSDASHNAAPQVTRTVKVVDTTAPTMIAPAASTAYSDINCQAAIPNLLPQTTASDLGGVVTLSQSPSAGTLVGVGSTTITITGRDPSNNSRSVTTAFTVVAGPSFTVSVNPNTVKRGNSVTLTTAFNNCASSSQALTLKVSLTKPGSSTLMVSLPLTLKAGQKGSMAIPVPISKTTPTGLYSLTLDVYLGSVKIGTSTAQLTVTQ